MRNKIRLGIVGCGTVMRYKHMRVLPKIHGLEIVGIADTDQAQLQCIAETFRFTRCFDSLEAMLANTELDAVAVLAPVCAHGELAKIAVAAGKHVFVEKPLALEVSEARELAALSESTDVHCMVGFHMRWHYQVLKARQLLANGALGRIECLRGTWACDARYQDLPTWRDSRETGGGCLIELGVHVFDLWRFLADSEVIEVAVMSRSDDWPDETAVCQARMENGTLVTGIITEHSRQDIEIDIHGTAGQIRLACLRFDGFQHDAGLSAQGDAGPTLRRIAGLLTGLPRGIANLPGGDYRDSYRAQWEHFVKCIQENRPVTPTFRDGLEATTIAQAAVSSAKTGDRVILAGRGE